MGRWQALDRTCRPTPNRRATGEAIKTTTDPAVYAIANAFSARVTCRDKRLERSPDSQSLLRYGKQYAGKQVGKGHDQIRDDSAAVVLTNHRCRRLGRPAREKCTII